MNKNYMLRGIGIGILIGALIMFTATRGTITKLKEDKIKNKTEATTEEVAEKNTEATTEKKTEATTEKKTEATTEKKTEATTEKETEATTEATTEKETEATTEATTEKKTETTTEKKTEATTEKKTEATTEKKTEATTEKTTESGKGGTVEVEIKEGMYSETVSELLERLGVVDDDKKFNSYLVSKGYDRMISVGKYKMKKGMSYEDAAKVLIEK